MKVLLAEGKPEQAVAIGLETLRIARLHDAEPLLINYLIGVAVRSIAARELHETLSTGSVSPQLHQQIDEEVARHDDRRRIVHALKTDRAYSAELTASAGLDTPCDQVNPIWMTMAGWPVKWMYLGALDSFDRHFTLATQPWDEVCRELGPPGSEPPSTGDGVLADLLLPALKAAYEANARDMATLRALRIVNALTQYRDEHGREASGLDDLSLPPEATIDPFSGQPLKLKHTDDGWVIYSVYLNGVDDDGDFKDQKDWGLAPRGKSR